MSLTVTAATIIVIIAIILVFMTVIIIAIMVLIVAITGFWSTILEYFLIGLGPQRNQYEIKVYNFSPWLLQSPDNNRGNNRNKKL